MNATLTEGDKITELNATYEETLEAVAFYKLMHSVIDMNHTSDGISMGSLARTILGIKAQIKENLKNGRT